MEERRTIIFIGDSLTEYFDWQARFPGYEVMNLGVSGETVEGLLERMDRIILTLSNPDFIFLMTGINNIANEDYEVLHVYKQIINKLFAVFGKSTIVIQSILPVELPWVDNNRIREINSSLKGLAKDYAAAYLDVYSLYTDENGNTVRAYLLEDGVHLSSLGYEVWSKAVEDFLS